MNWQVRAMQVRAMQVRAMQVRAMDGLLHRSNSISLDHLISAADLFARQAKKVNV